MNLMKRFMIYYEQMLIFFVVVSILISISNNIHN